MFKDRRCTLLIKFCAYSYTHSHVYTLISRNNIWPNTKLYNEPCMNISVRVYKAAYTCVPVWTARTPAETQVTSPPPTPEGVNRRPKRTTVASSTATALTVTTATVVRAGAARHHRRRAGDPRHGGDTWDLVILSITWLPSQEELANSAGCVVRAAPAHSLPAADDKMLAIGVLVMKRDI